MVLWYVDTYDSRGQWSDRVRVFARTKLAAEGKARLLTGQRDVEAILANRIG